MGIIGNINEPLLNQTINLIGSRNLYENRMEIYGLIDDSQIFENFSKEMYITKSKFKK
jgi:hypothetical protein